MPRDDERDDKDATPPQPAAPPGGSSQSAKAAVGASKAGASANPELAAYRSRIDEKLAARREALAGSRPPNLPAMIDPAAEEHGLTRLRESFGKTRTWLIAGSFAACIIAGGGALFAQYGSSGPTGELRQALQQERDRSERLSREIAIAWRQLTVQATALADRAAVEQEARDLRETLHQTEEASAGLEQTLSQERDRSRQLEQLLATRQVAGGKAPQAEIAALRQSLKQAQDELAAQAASLAEERDKRRKREEQIGSRSDLQQRETDELRQSLQQAQQKAEASQQLLAEERKLSARLDGERAAQEREAGQLRKALKEADERAASRERAVAAVVTDTPTAISNVVPATAGPADGSDLNRLMMRARALVGQGDIGAARSVLERAAETATAPALFALAETFDPAVLAAWGTVGTQGDPVRARELYTRALAGGVAEAKDRLAASRR
jgi:hypothetical protein